MRINTICIFITATLLVAACHSSKKSKTSADLTTVNEIQKPKAGAVTPVLRDTANFGKDAYKLSEPRVSGDTLFVQVEYSGGCKDHVFTARHNGQYMKSMPPQLNVTIDHNANGDKCRELIRETLAFDLKSCRQGKSGTLILLLNGDRAYKATYNF